MKKAILITVAFGIMNFAYGQQLPYQSQYMFNDYLINPAASGAKDYIPFMLTFRNQWTGFKDAPRTFTLSGNAPLAKQKIGVGGVIFSDRTGPISRTGIDMAYSYHIPVGDAKLAFGLSVMFFQYALDKSLLTTSDPDDNAIQGAVVRKFVPEGTFGIYYYGKNYYAGFSVPQIIQYKVDIGGTSLNRLTRHYFLTGGYRFEVSDEIDVEPSLLLKATTASPLQVDINAKGIYKKMIWLGVSYRTQEAAVVMLGGKTSGFGFGYSYDLTLTDIKKYSTGSHEIFLSYDLSLNKNKKALID